MRLVALSYDGHLLADDYKVIIKRPYLIPPIQSQWSPRGGETFDFFAGIQSGHGTIACEVYIIADDFRTARDTFQNWLAEKRSTPKRLVAMDLDDPNADYDSGFTEWYMLVVPETATLEKARKSTVVFSCADSNWPFWNTVNAENHHWDVTGSGETDTFEVLGNHGTPRPVISIVPNIAKTGSYAYKIWRPIFNPTDTPWQDEPFDLSEDVPGTVAFNTSGLINATSKSNQVNNVGGYDDNDLSIAIDTPVGGGLPTGGGMLYNAATGEQIYYTGIAGNTITVYDDGAGTTGRGWGGSTAASLGDNAVLTLSLMLKNGQDIRVLNASGQEVDCWVEGVGGLTKIWVNVDCEDRIQLTLDQAIAGAGAVASLKVKKNPVNLAALKELPSRYMVLIDDEPFIGQPYPVTGNDLNAAVMQDSVDLVNYKLMGLKRVYADYGESIAAHTRGTAINFVPDWFWIVYGNPLAEAQEVDSNKEPMIDMVNSTNLHRIWNSNGFRDDLSLRTAQVKLNVISTKSKNPVTSGYYTATHVDFADPATVAGLRVVNFFDANRWNIESARLSIDFPAHPAGYSAWVITGDKRRTSTSWVLKARFEKSINGITYVAFTNEATPAGTAWVSLGTLSGSIGASPVNSYFRFYVEGSTGTVADTENDFEIKTADLTVNSGRILKGAMRPVMDNYHFDLVLTNQTTNQAIKIKTPFDIGDTLIIDCSRGMTYRLEDNQKIPLQPGSVYPVLSNGSNTWLYEDEGTVDVSVDFDYYGMAWI